jgi:6,7-dimethyl-8-ribityllumazine synthase
MSSTPPIIQPPFINPNWNIAIVRAEWHDELTSALSQSAINTLITLGISRENIREVTVPGSFEIPLITQQLLRQNVDGAIVFGIVLQGATHHAEMIAREAGRACMDIQRETTKPIVCEILHVNTLEDAVSRSIGPKSKGPDAARTLLSCLAKKAELQQ